MVSHTLSAAPADAAVADRHPVPRGGQRPGAGGADASRCAGHQRHPWRHAASLPGGVGVPQRHSAVPTVRPAPNPHSSTRSPGATVPASAASASASGIDAGRGVAVAVDGGGGALRREAGAGQHRVDDAGVGLVGHEQGDVGRGEAGAGQGAGDRGLDGPHRPAEHLAAVHPQVVLAGGHGLGSGRPGAAARGHHQQVDARGVVDQVAGHQPGGRRVVAGGPLPLRTRAPAPSPNSTAVPRSSASITLVMVSAPMSRAVPATPAASRPTWWSARRRTRRRRR